MSRGENEKKLYLPRGRLGVSQSHPLEKKCKKPLDKPHGMWYNKDVKREQQLKVLGIISRATQLPRFVCKKNKIPS